MSKIDYTLWPNAGGTLGQNKIEIPDGVNTKWPDGDALVDNFVYQNGKLVGFVDNKALINNSSKTSNINYDYVRLHLENIGEGDVTFNLGERCKKFNVTYSSANSGDTIVFKYKGCTTVNEVKAVDPDYKTNDIVDGVWAESLSDLTNGKQMFISCTNLTSFTSNLSSLMDGSSMFYGCKNLTSFSSNLSSLTIGEKMFYLCTNLTSFSSDLSKLTNGDNMFNQANLSEFTADLSSLTNGIRMFFGCANLSSFSSDLSSLTDGNSMFYQCTNLTSFSFDLSSLTNGYGMFYLCNNLTSFSSDLSSLTNGKSMFYFCDNLTSFSSNLSSLTHGESMFYSCKNLNTFSSDLPKLTMGSLMFYNCYNLTTFNSDLSSLTNGSSMFSYCNKLTSFSSDLSSLMDGYYMFEGCKLDTASVQNIADTINTYYGIIYIGIGNSTPNEEENAAFEQIRDKGWSVYVNGSSYGQESCCSCCASSCCASLSTLDENGEETTETPIPYWAKPVPATKETAEFVDADGNYYNVLGAQFIYVSDPETYGMFTSREDAIANMRLKRIGEEEIETA